MGAAGNTSRVAWAAALLSAVLVVATPASAHWTAAGSGAGSGSTGTLAAPTGAGVPPNSLSGVPVTWTASGGSPAPTGYFVTRTSAGITAAACASNASTLLTGTSCADAGVPDGAYTYTVTAVYHSWTAASLASGSVSVWTPTQLAVTGQPTTTVAGTAISPAVAVTVQTAAGVAVPLAGRSVTVALGTNPGGGTLSGTLSGTTDSSGVVAFGNLRIDRSGSGYALNATSSGLTSTTSAAFTISAASADRFAITSAAVSGPASVSATLGPLTVTRQDALGNAASGGALTVTLASTSAGPVYFASTAGGTTTSTVTIASGQSAANFYYGDTKPGSPSIAVSGTLTSGTQVQSIVVGAANKLVITSGSIAGVASAKADRGPIAVQVRDIADNPVTTGIVVSLSSSTTGTAIFSPTLGGVTNAPTLTIAPGSSSGSFYYGDTKATGAGTVTVTAARSGLSSATLAGAITPAAASQLAFGQQPTTTAKGVTITPAITARILDAFGNLTTSTASLSIAIGTNPPLILGLGGGILSGTTTRSAVAGVATFNNLSINGALGVGGRGTGYTLVVSGIGSPVESTPFDIT